MPPKMPPRFFSFNTDLTSSVNAPLVWDGSRRVYRIIYQGFMTQLWFIQKLRHNRFPLGGVKCEHWELVHIMPTDNRRGGLASWNRCKCEIAVGEDGLLFYSAQNHENPGGRVPWWYMSVISVCNKIIHGCCHSQMPWWSNSTQE
jgi:hypothetical protein